MKPIRLALVISVVLSVALAFPAAMWAVDDDDIDASVARAVEYLKKSRTGIMWEHNGGRPEWNIGLTALCTMALMDAGVSRNDPVVVGGAKYVRDYLYTLDKDYLKNTYSLALAIILLDRYYADSGPLIEKLTVRIASAQVQQNGGWTYTTVPLDDKRHAEWMDFLKKNQEKSLADDQPKGGGSPSDNSNTQFAILALWIGRRHGIPVNYPLFLAERRFRKSQGERGGWNYGPEAGPSADTPAMTAAGLLALALGHSSSKETGVTIVRSGRKFDAGGAEGGGAAGMAPNPLDVDPQVVKAQKFILAYIAETPPDKIPSLTYFLWTLERVCVLYSWDKKFAGLDWYDWGSKLLLKMQDADGSWKLDDHSGPIAETAFAILFLRKANWADDARKVLVRSGNPRQMVPKPAGGNAQNPAGGGNLGGAAPVNPAVALQVEVNKLVMAAVNGAGVRQEEAIRKLRDTPGKEYTLGMVDAIKKAGGVLQNQLRDALAERLTRQNANSLNAYLKEPETELQAAAAWAAATKSPPCQEVIPNIIPLLGSTDDMVSTKALEALKIISGGEDFGKSAEKWKSWWDKSKRPPNAK